MSSVSKVRINDRMFTQPQILLLLRCDPYTDSYDINAFDKITSKYLIEEKLIEELEYNDGKTYLQITAKGKEYMP